MEGFRANKDLAGTRPISIGNANSDDSETETRRFLRLPPKLIYQPFGSTKVEPKTAGMAHPSCGLFQAT